MKLAVLIAAISLLAPLAEAKIKRSTTVRHEFVRLNACPSTGRHRLPCPGHVIDHRISLCVGGDDVPANLRWMTVESAKQKDRWECRADWEVRLRACELSGCFIN